MNIKKLNINELIPADYNPRVITSKELDNLKKSIHKFGYLELIVYNKRTNRIISGHQRLKALKELDIKEVEVIEVDLDEKDEKALNIAMNKISGDWDIPKLEILLNDLKLEGMLDLTGFSELELKELDKLATKLENENLEAEEDDFDESEVSENKYNVKRGDIYLLGNHRLACIDSTNIDEVKQLMDKKEADMVLTDPPYNTGMSEKSNSDSTWLNHMFNDSYTDEEWKEFLDKTIKNLETVMKMDSIAYIFLDWRRSYQLVPKIKQYLKLSNIVVWDKVVHGLGSDYKYTYELIHVCKKGKPELSTHYNQEYQDIWHIQRTMGKDEEHATKKPLELLVLPIKHASNENDIVLDLFGGSGSTLLACEETNRVCFMAEMSEHYCSVIIERYIKLKGDKEVYRLEPNGNKTHISEVL